MRIFLILLASVTLIINSGYASAAISLSATRIIYQEKQKEASINVISNSDKDTLIQSWLERDGNNMAPPPFAVTPPLAKIKGNQQQLLRILYQGSGLSQDKESVFWLSVQEIPQQVEGQNKLQMALRQRIKLFYRPIGLVGTASLAPTKLRVKYINNRLKIYNPTPYYINMVSFRQGSLDVNGKMIAPGDVITIAALGVKMVGEFDMTVINDFGTPIKFSGNFKDGISSRMKRNK